MMGRIHNSGKQLPTMETVNTIQGSPSVYVVRAKTG